ncbi:ribose-binding protein [Alicyclobacillus sacchari]|uniref:Ribose-binding protein n=2 Tax=Alicyclobacillus sacchari TaxID=392010 RepID=A0A4R8LHD5_9BACL|nr:D-ribose ABC transporter substrate-binding protein [Alicyclobacillus sacchari]TDY42145.1 ribose-binding protein [Alicyclobacillus sacchari]GMA59262.1 D-ribose ABC transporter substrate-binding protein [Alicyclobacillus sacchari]GMA59407.1 D-ribose ABC transporter substrate-binding protein [Alicyclobacillus sacchari]
MKKWYATLVAGAISMGAVAGCGTSPASQSNAQAALGGSASAKTIKIGFAVSTLNNPFFVAMSNGVQQEAKKLGVQVTVLNGNNDPATQLNQVEDLIQQHVSAIILNPADSQSLSTAVEQANRAHIPVVTLDRSVTKGNVACFIASNSVEAGKMAADELIKALGGKGQVVELQGVIGTSAEADREKGFDQEIAKASGIKVVARQTASFDRSQALNVMQNILQAHPNIQGVFAQNDEMALGALKAIQAAGKKHIKIVGIDGEKEAVADVHQGLMYADIAQQPTQEGMLGVEYAVKLAKGETVPKQVNSPLHLVEKNTAFTGF